MRRRLLLGLGVGLAGGALAWRALRRRAPGESAVAKVVATKLGYLETRAEDRQRFARDFAAEAPRAEEHLTHRDRFSGARMEALEDRICAAFLLSSDFFRNGADESRPVRYLALHDPWKVGCTNPFARFDVD
jgi:hypothetical protein